MNIKLFKNRKKKCQYLLLNALAGFTLEKGANVPRFSNLHLEYLSLGARIAPILPTLGIKKLSQSYHICMVSRRMSVRTADCERADCKTRAPDISCGRLDSSLLGAQRAPCKKIKIDPCLVPTYI